LRAASAAKALKAEVERTAREQRFNSLQDALNALPSHDGKMRLGTWLINYLGAPDTEHNRLAGTMFLVQMIKRAMEPGCKADYMLVLEGRQGARKSQAVAALDGSFGGEGLPVLDLGASRAQEHIVGLHVCEIPELHTVVRKNSQAAIKAFLTTTGDRLRMPYASRSQYFPRTCVFIGTTNETNGYLKDDTGNRRYWLVSVGEVDVEGLRRDRSQLLAEALAAYRAGVQSWPTDEQSELLFAPEQAKRLGRDPWIEVLADQLRDVYEVTGADCLRLLSVPVDRQGQSQLQRVGRCMQKLGWRRVNSNRDGLRCWVYQRG
jgi:predicted P-loop ATPase